VRGVFDLFAAEQFFDGEDLNARIAGAVAGLVEAGLDGFAQHGLCGFLEAKEDADFGLLAFERTAQIANLGYVHAARFDGEENLPGVAAVVVMKHFAAIDPAISALLKIGSSCADEAERPRLELIAVFMMGKLTRTFEIGGLSDDRICVANLAAEGIGEASLDKADGEMGDVDADPAAVELLGDLNGGAAAAEGIEDEVAFVGAGADDAFERASGF
jgi:hypothetical protein